MQQHLVTTAYDAYWTLDPFRVVRPGDPWFAEHLADLAHYGLGRRLGRELNRPTTTASAYYHVGVVGHRGSGKSTQVLQAACGAQAKGALLVYLDVDLELDTTSFTWSELLLTIARNTVASLDQQQLDIDPNELAKVHDWFAEIIDTEQRATTIEGAVTTGGQMTISIPLLAQLTAGLKGHLKSETAYRQDIRRKLERQPGQLLERTNTLLESAARALAADGRELPRVIVIIDNLEKVARSQVDIAVIQRAQDLQALHCDLVLFFDPSYLYAPRGGGLRNAFEYVTLPMLPVRDRNDDIHTVSPAALNAVRALLAKRFSLADVFAEPEPFLRRLTAVSGGRLRDIILLCQLACREADAAQVTMADLEAVIRNQASLLSVNLKPNDDERLRQIHRTKRIENIDDDHRFLADQLVLDYNGDPWWDIHPLLLQAEPLRKFG